jgi:hypothetical protein
MNNQKGYKYRPIQKIMIKEYAGLALSSLAVLGFTGEVGVNYVDSIILFGAVIVVLSTLLWSFLYKRNLGFFLSAFFGSTYALWGFVYLQKGVLWSNFIGLGYFAICLMTMKLTIDNVANEKSS